MIYNTVTIIQCDMEQGEPKHQIAQNGDFNGLMHTWEVHIWMTGH